MIEDFEEEVRLFHLAKKNYEDFEEFIKLHLFIVKIVISRYRGLDEYDDLYQEGCIGLIIAFNNFDPSKGVRFRHYCKYWIRNRIQDFAWRRSVVKTTREEFLYGKKPSIANLEDEDIENILVSPDIPIFVKIQRNQTAKIIKDLLSCLTKKERKILEMYFGLGKHHGMSYAKVGESLGFTKQRIQQVVKQAEAKMKEMIDQKDLNKDLSP
jgi:RNA polymerase sporulation-specific sigma factor